MESSKKVVISTNIWIISGKIGVSWNLWQINIKNQKGSEITNKESLYD